MLIKSVFVACMPGEGSEEALRTYPTVGVPLLPSEATFSDQLSYSSEQLQTVPLRMIPLLVYSFQDWFKEIIDHVRSSENKTSALFWHCS